MLKSALVGMAMVSVASVAAAETGGTRLSDAELDRVSAGFDLDFLIPSLLIGGDDEGNFGIFNAGNRNTGIGNAGTRNFGIGNRGNRNVGLFLSGGSNFGIDLSRFLENDN